MTLDQAYARCTELAHAHYENFPVGRLVPAGLAKHVHAVYAFARHTDDLADEGYAADHDFGERGLPAFQPTREERLAALRKWEADLLHAPAEGDSPILIAVRNTIRELDLPPSLFTDLLGAFQQDVVKARYRDYAEVLDYCRRSANPIGRLVLLLHGHREPERLLASDAICTALQLANFWQDVSVDLLKDRIYLPQDEMAAHGVTVADLQAGRATPGFRRLVETQVERTRKLFARGEGLSRELPWPLSWEIRLTWLGGSRILDKIVDLHYDTLHERPKLSKLDLPLLLGQTVLSA